MENSEMRTIPDYSEWETLTLYFYRFLVRNSTNSYLSYYQIYNIHSHFPDQTKNNREENN